MSFDAGEIVAYLKLNRDGFGEELDEAKADAEEKFGKPIEARIKPDLDEEAMDQVLAEEEPLRRDIRPEVKPTYVEGEAEAVGRSLANDILSGAEARGGSKGGGGIGSLIGAMLGEGLNQNEIASGLKNLGFSSSEVKEAIGTAILGEIGRGGAGDSTVAREIVQNILPPPALVSEAMGEEIDQWYKQLGPSPGIRETTSNGDGLMGKLIAGMIGKGATQQDIANGLKNLGFTSEEVSQAIIGTLEGGVNDLERNGGNVKVGNDFQSFFRRVIGTGSNLFDSLTLGDGGVVSAIFNPLGIAAGTAFVGAFGLALGGAVAGTSIGLAGVLAAVIPGLLDLVKGYEAHVAETTKGASLAGFTPAQLGLGNALGKLVGDGSKGLGAAETEVMPQITKFINAVTKAIPLMDKFAKPAIAAMTGFFDSIDKGMGSGGFKTFVDEMSKDVGPIMKEFGTFILNMGGAFGGFLELFGGADAESVGHWFDDASKRLDKFLHHVQLGKGFITDMKKTFKDLGDVLKGATDIMGKFGGALLPIGVGILGIVGPFAKWTADIIKLIPSGVFEALVGGVIALAAGMKLLALAMALFNAASDINPYVLAISLVVVVIILLIKYWKDLFQWGVDTHVAIVNAWKDFASWFGNDVVKPVVGFFKSLWDQLKKDTTDGVRFIDNLLHNDLALALLGPLGAIIYLGEHWKTIWDGMKTTVTVIWDAIKPVLKALGDGVKAIVKGLQSAVGLAGKVGHGVHTGLNDLNPLHWLASGGPASAGSPYIVGEQGPELFVPSVSGNVVPNGSFGRGNQIVFQIDARGHTNPQQIRQAVRNSITASLPSLQAALSRGAA